jgi:hypothetical protein
MTITKEYYLYDPAGWICINKLHTSYIWSGLNKLILLLSNKSYIYPDNDLADKNICIAFRF